MTYRNIFYKICKIKDYKPYCDKKKKGNTIIIYKINEINRF